MIELPDNREENGYSGLYYYLQYLHNLHQMKWPCPGHNNMHYHHLDRVLYQKYSHKPIRIKWQ